MRTAHVIALATIAFCLVACVTAQPKVMKAGERLPVPKHYSRGSRVQEGHTVDLILALPLRNTDEFTDRFWKVSDPSHPSYGQYLSVEQLRTAYGAAQEHIDATQRWCDKHAMACKVGQHHDTVSVSMLATEAERQFAVELHEWKDTQRGDTRIMADRHHSLPDELSFVTHVGGLHEFHHINMKPVSKPTAFAWTAAHNALHPAGLPISYRTDVSPQQLTAQAATVLGDNPINKTTIVVGTHSSLNSYFFVFFACADGSKAQRDTNNRFCYGKAKDNDTTAFVSSLTLFVDVVSHQGLSASTAPQTFDLTDPALGTFTSLGNFTVVALRLRGLISYQPNTVRVVTTLSDGSNWAPTSTQITPEAYTTLDNLHEIYRIPRRAQAKQAASVQAFASFTLTAGIAPSDISTFERLMDVDIEDLAQTKGHNAFDPNNPQQTLDLEASLDSQTMLSVGRGVDTWYILSNGYMVEYITKVLGFTDAHTPLVHSISYGAEEHYLDASSKQFLDDRLKMLGLKGVTVFASSGDDGVGGNSNNCTRFKASYPATSPYVTSVGATMRTKDTRSFCSSGFIGSVVSMLECTSVGERVCSTETGGIITSGGGFSDAWTINEAPYQRDAVANFFERAALNGQLPDGSRYNANGRGFPDMAMLGHNFVIVGAGQTTLVDGTSASSPATAAMFAIINDRRLASGMPALGFLNPFLYQAAARHPESFTDITSGNNKCARYGKACCQQGFYATVGWDPATGLGTPNFPSLFALAMDPQGPNGFTNSFVDMATTGAQGPTGPQGPAGMDATTPNGSAMSPVEQVLLYVALGLSALVAVAVVVIYVRSRNENSVEASNGARYSHLG